MNSTEMSGSINVGDATITVTNTEDRDGGMVSSQVKFDNYFMYGID